MGTLGSEDLATLQLPAGATVRIGSQTFTSSAVNQSAEVEVPALRQPQFDEAEEEVRETTGSAHVQVTGTGTEEDAAEAQREAFRSAFDTEVHAPLVRPQVSPFYILQVLGATLPVPPRL